MNVSGRYEHLLSPLKIGNVTLKNHMISTKCAPPLRSFEKDTWFYYHLAKNGASMVVMDAFSYPGRELELLPNGKPTRPPATLDMTNESVRQSVREFADKLHSYGTLLCISLMEIEPIYLGLSEVPDYEALIDDSECAQTMYFKKKRAMTTEELERMIEEFAWRCKDAQSLGADACNFYMSYRSSMLAHSLSPVFNRRTDRFGGSTMRERATLSLEMFRRIRELCGPDFLITVKISGEETLNSRGGADGYTVDEWVEYCQLCDGLVDIMQVVGNNGSMTHATGVNHEKGAPPTLRYAEAFKRANLRHTLVAPNSAFTDVDDMERFLAEGKADLMAMSRRFLADSDFYQKLREGRGEDIRPCLLCNECHGPTPSCSINPLLANHETYPAPTQKKKVAVIGGGPGGMQAALTAASRGHSVVLFEKNDRLGGQLIAAGALFFKWPIHDYLEYMAVALARAGVDVRLNTEATPDTIRSEGFDAVIAAIGSAGRSVPLPGAEQDFIVLAEDAILHPEKLGQRVVVIGGGDTGRETALQLAHLGHTVTMLTRKQAMLFHDFHCHKSEEDAFLHQPGLSYLEHASVQEINEHSVVCTVKRGIPKQVQGFRAMGVLGMGYVPSPDVPESLPPANSCMSFAGGRPGPAPYDETNAYTETVELPFDSLVISGGRRPLTELADAFESAAPTLFRIGDCVEAKDIKSAVAAGYDAAMRL